jgi:hypothetical protein
MEHQGWSWRLDKCNSIPVDALGNVYTNGVFQGIQDSLSYADQIKMLRKEKLIK